MRHIVYLALGTNLGERLENLQRARIMLRPAVRILAESPVYETPPWGYADQPAFLNQVIKGETELSPLALLAYLKRLEEKMGRQVTFRYGPRQIDLDILLYEDLVLKTPDLEIPHPRMAERAFVLVPLADLASDLNHPVLQRTVKDLLADLDSSGISRYQNNPPGAE